MFGDLFDSDLLGLQVYYTNGASLYEKFRACTESLICDSSCTERFNSFFQDNELIKRKARFITEKQKKLDFYVNFRFTGIKDVKLNLKPCCADFLRRKFEFRPTPGSGTEKTKYVGFVDPELFRSRMILEMSGPTHSLKETTTYYSVVIVDIDAPMCVPYQHYVIANLEYPGAELDMKTLKIGQYEPPMPPDGPHIYLILLYSHTDEKPLSNRPCGSHSIFTENSAELRSVSWFRSSNFDACYAFDCPKIPGVENPFTLIGVFKDSSEFPPEVLTSPSINDADNEVTNQNTVTSNEDNQITNTNTVTSNEDNQITNTNAEFTHAIATSLTTELQTTSTYSEMTAAPSSTVESRSTSTNRKNASPTKVTKKVVTTEKSKSGSCSHVFSFMSLTNIFFVLVGGILK